VRTRQRGQVCRPGDGGRQREQDLETPHALPRKPVPERSGESLANLRRNTQRHGMVTPRWNGRPGTGGWLKGASKLRDPNAFNGTSFPLHQRSGGGVSRTPKDLDASSRTPAYSQKPSGPVIHKCEIP